MTFKRFNINIISRLSLIIILSIGGTVYLISTGPDIYFLFLVVIEILIVINLIRYFNRSNDEISLFLSSVLNEDSSLVFNESTGNKSYDHLHKSINRLNDQIKNARMNVIIQEKFYQAVVENSYSGLLAFNHDGIIKLTNTKARELLGIKHLHNIRQLQRVNDRLIKTLNEIKPGSRQLLNIIINDSAMHLSLNATEIKLRNEHIKVVSINDISHEIDKQEIDSWQKLIRILNHEIMNSVAPITSLSSTISGLYKENGRQKKANMLDDKTISKTLKGLSVIEEHGKGLISFVDSYRSLTKLPDLKPREIYIKDIFESVIMLSASFMEDNYPGVNILLRNSVEPEDLIICADESLITRVLFNMVKNSVEALQDRSDPVVLLEAERSSTGKTTVKVTDNGEGMDEELLERIFIPFFTTRTKGNGIGLSLSRQIINMHKGSITVKSSPEEGTTMIISI